MNNRGITRSGVHKHKLDKFYTKPEVAAECIKLVNGIFPLEQFDEIIEPSAGNGAFSKQLENVTAYDIQPEDESIIEQDFLELAKQRNGNILAIGNPPFGQQNNLAIKFINHAASFANVIAYIVPPSFQKDHIQSKLNEHLKLLNTVEIEKNSFVLDGTDIDVPSVFQIYQYDVNYVRPPLHKFIPNGFSFVTKNENPDLWLQRIGRQAGSFGKSVESKDENRVCYFLKVDGDLENFLADLQKLSFSYRDWTIGPRSIGKQELLKELFEIGSSFSKEVLTFFQFRSVVFQWCFGSFCYIWLEMFL